MGVCAALSTNQVDLDVPLRSRKGGILIPFRFQRLLLYLGTELGLWAVLHHYIGVTLPCIGLEVLDCTSVINSNHYPTIKWSYVDHILYSTCQHLIAIMNNIKWECQCMYLNWKRSWMVSKLVEPAAHVQTGQNRLATYIYNIWM